MFFRIIKKKIIEQNNDRQKQVNHFFCRIYPHLLEDLDFFSITLLGFLYKHRDEFSWNYKLETIEQHQGNFFFPMHKILDR
jgi:hypothetical protein